VTKRLSPLACAVLLACGPRPGSERPSDLQLASLGEPATAALVVGCWELTWRVERASTTAVDRPMPAMPDSIRLREEVVFGSPERLVAPATHPLGRRSDGSGEVPWEARLVVNRWWMEGDSLRIRFSDGGDEEWSAALGTSRAGITGTGHHASDPTPAGGATRADVTGRRIACDF
jgi:hypothetical protein